MTPISLNASAINSDTQIQNPFKKKLLFNKKPIAETEKTEAVADPFAKPINFNKKIKLPNTKTEEETVAATEVTETVAVATTETIIEEKTDEQTVVAEVSDTIENAKTESAVTETVDKIDDTSTDIVAEPAPTEKKKRTRRSKQEIEAAKATEAITSEPKETTTETATVSATTDKEVVEVHNNSTIEFNEAINEFSSIATDEKWLEYKADVEKSYAAITLTPDINSAMITGVVCQLANLRDKIWVQLNYYKTQYESLSSKEPEGIIERVKRINIDETANNDMRRKKSGIVACVNYKTKDGEIINLYDLLDEVRARYYFLNSIMSNIEFKKNLLITISGALKIETSLTGNT